MFFLFSILEPKKTKLKWNLHSNYSTAIIIKYRVSNKVVSQIMQLQRPTKKSIFVAIVCIVLLYLFVCNLSLLRNKRKAVATTTIFSNVDKRKSNYGIQIQVNDKMSQSGVYYNSETPSVNTTKYQRRHLFIIAQGRTGSSLLGDLIDRPSKKDFLYFFEPLRAVERYLDIAYFHLNSTNDPMYTKYHNIADRFINNLLNCRFDRDDDAILKLHDEGSFRHRSKLMTQHPFCNSSATGKGVLCESLTSKVLNQYCLDHPNTNIVIKELEFRIPEASILRILKRREDVKVIHLVRDPRSFLVSMKRLGWLDTPGSDREDVFIEKRCLEIQNNIVKITRSDHGKNVARNRRTSHLETPLLMINGDSEIRINKKSDFPKSLNPPILRRYKILKYEDLAQDTSGRRLGIALSEFLDLDFVADTTKFFVQKFTNKKNSSGESAANPFSTGRRNIKDFMGGWRDAKYKNYVKKIENYCRNLMVLLDYKVSQNTNS